jgi:hypothetical protein
LLSNFSACIIFHHVCHALARPFLFEECFNCFHACVLRERNRLMSSDPSTNTQYRYTTIKMTAVSAHSFAEYAVPPSQKPYVDAALSLAVPQGSVAVFDCRGADAAPVHKATVQVGLDASYTRMIEVERAATAAGIPFTPGNDYMTEAGGAVVDDTGLVIDGVEVRHVFCFNAAAVPSISKKITFKCRVMEAPHEEDLQKRTMAAVGGTSFDLVARAARIAFNHHSYTLDMRRIARLCPVGVDAKTAWRDVESLAVLMEVGLQGTTAPSVVADGAVFSASTGAAAGPPVASLSRPASAVFSASASSVAPSATSTPVPLTTSPVFSVTVSPSATATPAPAVISSGAGDAPQKTAASPVDQGSAPAPTATPIPTATVAVKLALKRDADHIVAALQAHLDRAEAAVDDTHRNADAVAAAREVEMKRIIDDLRSQLQLQFDAAREYQVEADNMRAQVARQGAELEAAAGREAALRADFQNQSVELEVARVQIAVIGELRTQMARQAIALVDATVHEAVLTELRVQMGRQAIALEASKQREAAMQAARRESQTLHAEALERQAIALEAAEENETQLCARLAEQATELEASKLREAASRREREQEQAAARESQAARDQEASALRGQLERQAADLQTRTERVMALERDVALLRDESKGDQALLEIAAATCAEVGGIPTGAPL